MDGVERAHVVQPVPGSREGAIMRGGIGIRNAFIADLRCMWGGPPGLEGADDQFVHLDVAPVELEPTHTCHMSNLTSHRNVRGLFLILLS